MADQDVKIIERLAAIEARLGLLSDIKNDLSLIRQESTITVIELGALKTKVETNKADIERMEAKNWQLTLAVWGAVLASLGTILTTILLRQ